MFSERMQKIWDGFSDKEKQAINERYEMLRSEYMTLQELRQNQHYTQETMAELMGVKQGHISRMEKRDDMLLSTLSEYIEALGGEVQINAIFNDKIIPIINPADKGKHITQC